MDSNLVYSTEHGRMCPDCNNPIDKCNCKENKPILKSDGITRIFRETKGRKGKTVTVITGLGLTDEKLFDRAKQLKQHCGTGGTIKNGTIEIQGDHRDKIFAFLEKAGHTVKKSGG